MQKPQPQAQAQQPQPAKPQPPAQEPKVVANTEESVEKIALELIEE